MAVCRGRDFSQTDSVDSCHLFSARFTTPQSSDRHQGTHLPKRGDDRSVFDFVRFSRRRTRSADSRAERIGRKP
jgi:hypothetical protein